MKRIKQIKTFFILLLFFPFILVAQIKTFTIDEAIQTAIENNRDIKIALMNVQKSDAAVSEAFGYALPKLDASASFSHFLKKPKMSFPDFEALLTNAAYSILFDENVIPRDDSKFRPVNNTLQSFVQANNFETNLQLTQTLFSSAVFKGIGASQIYLNLAKEDLKNQVSETVLNVQEAFYGVLLTKELLKITEESFKNAQDNLVTVNAMFDQGLVAEFDKLQAEVQVENIRPVVSQMQNNLLNAKNALKIVVGIDQQTEIDVTGEFSFDKMQNLEEGDLVQQAVKSNYGVKTLMLKEQVDEAFVDLDRAEFWPTLAAFGNYSYAGTSDKWNFQTYSSLTIGLNLSINLFSGGQTKSRIEQSTITYLQTQEQLNQFKDLIKSQVKAKLLEIQRVTALLDAQERNVQLAQRSYDIAVVKYKEGTATQIEVQNTDLALKQAKINKLQSLYSYMITKFELEQLLGQTNERYIGSFRNSED
ncbi:TolC family protein [bacterium BMS3Abin03]|nr:TolC family protein [bacterium BMS3Abin03]MCG6958395.1 TolC family protein [bacterium BMS3Abin03]